MQGVQTSVLAILSLSQGLWIPQQGFSWLASHRAALGPGPQRQGPPGVRTELMEVAAAAGWQEET